MSEIRLTEAQYDAITEAAAQWCMRLHEPDCTDRGAQCVYGVAERRPPARV